MAFRQVDNVKHTYGEAKEEVERELYQKSKDMEKSMSLYSEFLLPLFLRLRLA